MRMVAAAGDPCDRGRRDLLREGLEHVVGGCAGGGGAGGRKELLRAMLQVLGPDVACRAREEVLRELD